jgi:hypothetical protein
MTRMSDHTDVLNRYLSQQPGIRKTLLTDPVQHARIETLRQTLDATDRAMVDEGVPDEARRRVLNRLVWGDAEGQVDMYAQAQQLRAQVFDACDLPESLTQA